ncbi:MAG: AmmeMemoRadiSam system protein A [Candidatus Woesearchaeota archaeon]
MDRDLIIEILLIIGILVLSFLLISSFSKIKQEEKVIYGKHKPFYEKIPSDIVIPNVSCDGDLFALILPHAGYYFSYQTLIYGFELLKSCSNFNKIVILYPNHYTSEDGIRAIKADKFIIDNYFIRLEYPDFLNETSDFNDHAFEIFLPLIHKYFPNISVIGIVINTYDPENFKKLIDKYKKDAVFIISSDFVHYGKDYGFYSPNFTLEWFDKLNYEIAQSILNKDLNTFEEISLNTCGRLAIRQIMEYFENSPYTYKAKILNYSNSYQRLRSDHVVGYFAIAIYRVIKLNDEKKKLLLDLARKSIEYYLTHGKIMQYKTDDEELNLKKGVFVTLTKHGLLRGCIGYLEGIKPLYQEVIENAVNAAFFDPRFEPLEKEELDEIDIEISILTEPKPLYYENSSDLLNKLSMDMGVIIEHYGRTATFLPQVWEDLPNKELFLSELCRKAGLSPDTWKKSKIKVYIYRAEKFKESDYLKRKI